MKYKFKCDKCSNEFMKIVPANTKDAKCIKCNGEARKVFTLPEKFVVKGTFGEVHL